MNLPKELINSKKWQVLEQEKLKTGQARIYYIKDFHGNEGVFRRVKLDSDECRKSEAIQRYRREVIFLTSPSSVNENIIEVLDHGEDEQNGLFWYLTRRGILFDDWWQKQIKDKTDDQIYDIAIKVVLGLSNGLAIAHKNNVVHRDLKPLNVVVIDDVVKIIDWGLCHIQGGDRISNKDYPAYNRAFSPAYLYFHRNEIPKWVDIFQLSQFLIYLLIDSPEKKIVAPIHWKWALYRPGLSIERIQRLTLFARLCSEDNTCPMDGTIATNIINDLLVMNDKKKEEWKDEGLEKFLEHMKLESIESDTILQSKLNNVPIDVLPALSMYDKISQAFTDRISLFKERTNNSVPIEIIRHINSATLINSGDLWIERIKGKIKNPALIMGNRFAFGVDFGFGSKKLRLLIEFHYDFSFTLENRPEVKKTGHRPRVQISLNLSPISGSGIINLPDKYLPSGEWNGSIISSELILSFMDRKIDFSDFLNHALKIIEDEELWQMTK